MKNISLFIIALFSTIYSASADTEKTIDSKIKHVTVFLKKAQITRAAKTTVDAGLTNLVFAGLSAYIDKQSIQVSGKGGIVIMSVQHKVNYLDQQKKTPKLIKLEDSLKYYRRELEQYANVVDVLTKEENMILKNQAIGGQDNGVSITELKRAADFFRTRLTDIRTRRLKNDRKIQKINKRVVKINSQLNELNKRRNQPTGEILVSVSAKARTTATLELNYLVQNAGWVPVYDLRAKDTKSPIQLSYKANVWQNTG
ncbi:MAG: mucoidy inhibitor MuiA family protein, partial [Bacteroidetes bacterium]|nr:mucoidy inhibitor MuiA family protein [Bacteroidota bacterium]